LTFPTHGPTRHLDHILTDDPRLLADDCQAVELPISDHRALVVDVSRR
jgi:endonuclease/exonuclease/phosphatase family metal-dependent hydrolase